MNVRWHERHVLPRSATTDERIAWHRAHQKACACRPIPAKLLAEIESRAGTTRVRTASDVDRDFARIVTALAGDPGVTHGGKGFGSSGLKVNGKLFAMISSKKTFVVKLPRHRAEELVRLGKGEPFDPGHGRLMKEWVVVRGAPKTWLALAKEAHRFVRDGASAARAAAQN